MILSVQFLEGGPDSARVPPGEARDLLRSAFDRAPIDNVLLGWNLPPALIEACAAECSRRRADLYLWQPLLAGDGVFQPRPEWRTIGADGRPISDSKNRDEFTFVCPNRAGAREAVLQHLEDVLSCGCFQGVFLDRIRFPSPAESPGRMLACFCEDCARAAENAWVDLASVRRHLEWLLQTGEGKRSVIASFLSPPNPAQYGIAGGPLEQLMNFRRRSITAVVREAAGLARARGLKVGLDCFSPTLARMVGQDLAELSAFGDWIKGMTYIRAFGPAAIPYEIFGLAGTLLGSGEDEIRATAFLAGAAEWDLPERREAIRRGGLPSTVLAEEISRGRKACVRPFLAGIELVDMPGIAELHPETIRGDMDALLAAAPDGIVLSWDLRHIPLERLEMVNEFLSRGSKANSGPAGT
jgi:hypothetical protein